MYNKHEIIYITFHSCDVGYQLYPEEWIAYRGET